MSHGHGATAEPQLCGLMAEFETENAIIHATEQVAKGGYHHVEAYTPYVIEEVLDHLHLHKNHVALVILIGGLVGCAVGFGMQYFASAIHYPLNVGGRPFNSWPSFIPVMFECTVLFASFAAVIGMLLMNGLPRPHHPVFNVDRFQYATQDRFFLYIDAHDPKFDRTATRRFLESLHPYEVSEVEG
ncbi:MAG: DUF3341 domain-containing protein [candidate division Zixibacteria bacterium]|nr:DUF3341 domain-containing protein [candidate division Zixibacteria bacterium]